MFTGPRLCLLLLCSTVMLRGQVLPVDPPLQCGFQAAPPTLVRAEGISERVGDILIACTGGTPTQIGAEIPRVNIRIFFNAPIASRVVAATGAFSEALLLIDEPNSPANPQTPLRLCGDTNTNESPTNPGVCRMFGSLDENTYSGANLTPGISPNNRPNVFQGRQVAANAIEFVGVPIDPRLPLFPGRFPARLLRITNLRVNPSVLGDSNSPLPKQISAFLSITGFPGIGFLPTQTVGYAQPSMQATVVDDRARLRRCESRNPMQTAFTVRMTEGFPSAFKPLNSAQSDLNANAYPAVFANQNIPGASYETEDGFINTTVALGRAYADPRRLAFPDVRGMRSAGAADSGTRLSMQFRELPRGVQLWIPGVLTLRSKLTGQPTGRAVLIADTGPFAPRATDENGFAQLTISGSETRATYEVLRAEPFDIEQLDVPVSVVYDAAATPPEVGIQSTVSAGLSTRDDSRTQRFDAFTIGSCDCNLLFPVASNRNGYDTGIAISNTGSDTGKITLHYFCGTENCTPPATQATLSAIEPGRQLTFTLSGGGGEGIQPVPGFQGYIVARAEFRYCHGFAMLSAINSLATSNGAFRAYLALVLDRPAFRDDVSISESLGH